MSDPTPPPPSDDANKKPTPPEPQRQPQPQQPQAPGRQQQYQEPPRPQQYPQPPNQHQQASRPYGTPPAQTGQGQNQGQGSYPQPTHQQQQHPQQWQQQQYQQQRPNPNQHQHPNFQHPTPNTQHFQQQGTKQLSPTQQKIVDGVKEGAAFTLNTARIAFRVTWAHVVLLVFFFIFNLVIVITDLVQYFVFEQPQPWLAFFVVLVINLIAFNIFYIMTLKSYVAKRVAWEVYKDLVPTIQTMLLNFVNKVMPEKDGKKNPPPKHLVTFANILTGWIDRLPIKVQNVLLKLLDRVPIYNIFLDISRNTDDNNRVVSMLIFKAVDANVGRATQYDREIKFFLIALAVNVLVIIMWFSF